MEPFDEGIYQCFARNDYGEASTTFYLHVNPRILLNYPPDGPKCHSTDDGNLKVTFNRQNEDKFNSISYIASFDKPNSDSGFSTILNNENNFTIARSILRDAKALKPFHLYMRFMFSSGISLTPSLLSKPITCAFQQIEPKLIKATNGIKGSFLSWNVDVSKEDLSETTITIQFLKNSSTDGFPLSGEVVGSYEKIDEAKTWADIERSLQKFSVNASDNDSFSEIKVKGNVSGIFIPNVNEVVVRVFGSIAESGMHILQDYEDLKWKILKSPHEDITVSDIQSRSITISWSELDSYKCLQACTYLKTNVSPIFLRDRSTKLNCEKM